MKIKQTILLQNVNLIYFVNLIVLLSAIYYLSHNVPYEKTKLYFQSYAKEDKSEFAIIVDDGVYDLETIRNDITSKQIDPTITDYYDIYRNSINEQSSQTKALKFNEIFDSLELQGIKGNKVFFLNTNSKTRSEEFEAIIRNAHKDKSKEDTKSHAKIIDLERKINSLQNRLEENKDNNPIYIIQPTQDKFNISDYIAIFSLLITSLIGFSSIYISTRK